MTKYILILANIFIFTGCISLNPEIEYSDSIIPAKFKNNVDENINSQYIQPNWESFIYNPKLKQLVQLAIDNNKDLKIAILNIEAARATYRIKSSKYFPSIDAKGNATHTKSVVTENNTQITHSYSAEIGASYELDLFNKTKSLSESALESYLATQFAATSTKISLISEVVNLWCTLASNIEQLQLLEDNVKNLKVSHELTQKKFDLGITLINDVFSSKTMLKEAEVNLINFKTIIEKNKNALELLVSTNIPENLLPNNLAEHNNWLILIQTGISSDVLFSRPDIIEAEHNLKAKNADIGVARAAFFPSITLTTATGFASNSLSTLFNGNAQSVWSFVPSINLPIFKGGENKANLDYAKAQQKISLEQYEKTIQSAFKDVSDFLIIKSNINAQIIAQEDLVDVATKNYEVSLNSYKYGIGTYLNVLEAQRTLYSAKKSLVEINVNELINRVNLYASLGGNGK